MVNLTVLYPRSASSHFDHDYYQNQHIPLVHDRLTRMGLHSVRLFRGTGTLDQSTPPFEMIGMLAFPSMAELSAALEAHGGEIVGDIPNFTDIEPVIQISEEV